MLSEKFRRSYARINAFLVEKLGTVSLREQIDAENFRLTQELDGRKPETRTLAEIDAENKILIQHLEMLGAADSP